MSFNRGHIIAFIVIRAVRIVSRKPTANRESSFAIELWNQHAAGLDGIAQTTNCVEGWHYGLQSLFQCHHPIMWNFLAGIKKDLQQQKARLVQGVAGLEHPRKKKYRNLNDRVQRTVSA